MKEFIHGLITGFILKEKIVNVIGFVLSVKHSVFKKKNIVEHEEIFFVCKITNRNLIKKIEIRPNWEYYPNKEVIRIPIDIPFNEFMESCNNSQVKDLLPFDINYFQLIGETYLFVNYLVDDKKYINVYSDTDSVNISDFKYNETDFRLKSNGTICYSLKNNNKLEYISNYIKMFYNSTRSELLIPRILLYNYSVLDIDLESDINLNVVNSNGIITKSINEPIH